MLKYYICQQDTLFQMNFSTSLVLARADSFTEFLVFSYMFLTYHTSAKRFHKMAVVSNHCNLHFSWLSVSPHINDLSFFAIFFFLICHFFHIRNIFLFDINIIIFKINFFILAGDIFIVNSWLSTTMVLTSVSEETIKRFQ